MVIAGLYPSYTSSIPLHIQPSSLDSLEPTYPCAAATTLSSTYAVKSTNPAWLAHLNAASALFKTLDSASNIEVENVDWHQSIDHYFDNLSARQCHGLPLPASISQATADAVYRLGQHEYSLIYRALRPSLRFAVGSFGVWFAELAANVRQRRDGGGLRYKHNVAHDGSISRLLAVLQVERMVWPGMGAEVVFEVYKTRKRGGEGGKKRWIRVLWGGQVLVSSNPVLGRMEMLDLEVFLGYVDGLVGVKARKVVEFCGLDY
jgi:acid phosphatase